MAPMASPAVKVQIQMLDFCRKHKHNHNLKKTAAHGFTLLEILVVLALVGLLTAFSLPQFGIIRDRLTYTLNRDSFESEISNLSYRAFKEGRALVLVGEYPRNPKDEETALERLQKFDEGQLSREPGQMRQLWPLNVSDATLSLPEEWRAVVAKPIIYNAAGFCDGGAVTLLIGQSSYTYNLKAPTCQAQPEQ
jgi:prepilin-type N-terminal cleavage/methylation domain-containing protein